MKRLSPGKRQHLIRIAEAAVRRERIRRTHQELVLTFLRHYYQPPWARA